MVIYPALSLWCPVGSGFSPPVGHLPVQRPSHDLNHFPAATDQALPPSKNQHLPVLLWSHIPTPWFAVSVSQFVCMFQSSACGPVCLPSKHIPCLPSSSHPPSLHTSLGLDVQLYTALRCLVHGWICTQYWTVDGSLGLRWFRAGGSAAQTPLSCYIIIQLRVPNQCAVSLTGSFSLCFQSSCEARPTTNIDPLVSLSEVKQISISHKWLFW